MKFLIVISFAFLGSMSFAQSVVAKTELKRAKKYSGIEAQKPDSSLITYGVEDRFRKQIFPNGAALPDSNQCIYTTDERFKKNLYGVKAQEAVPEKNRLKQR